MTNENIRYAPGISIPFTADDFNEVVEGTERLQQSPEISFGATRLRRFIPPPAVPTVVQYGTVINPNEPSNHFTTQPGPIGQESTIDLLVVNPSATNISNYYIKSGEQVTAVDVNLTGSIIGDVVEVFSLDINTSFKDAQFSVESGFRLLSHERVGQLSIETPLR